MAPNGTLAVGLNSLADWLSEASEGGTFSARFRDWVRDSGWQSAGVAWAPSERQTQVVVATPETTQSLAELPAAVAEACGTLPASTAFPVGPCGRAIRLPDRADGLLWAEKPTADPWTEVECSYLSLSARLIERCLRPAASESDRLNRRLDDVAVIAGRLAHDFDNILTGIIGFSDLTAPLLDRASQPAKFVAEIAKIGHRGTVFTQQLHQLSRSGIPRPQPGSVGAALAREEARLRGTTAGGPRVEIALPESLPSVAMDVGLLGTVFGHLLDNAVEATPAAGPVAVTAGVVDLSPRDAHGYLGKAEAGRHVEVSVRDRGPGVKPDVRTKLFAEPFFTTKVRHRGLGLAIVFRTLTAHRGGIRIEPADGGPGLLVRVVVPLARPTGGISP